MRLFDTKDWTYDTIRRIHDACEEIALREMGLEVYPNQIEIITAEQMLDAYSSAGMPLFYHHWSFGKHFAHHEALYRRGLRGLAYEIVINSSPCIAYLMEENSAVMQTLTVAHACFGHNHFFKHNYMFRQWTDAAGILDYLAFAKKYVADCEDRHGFELVESTLDAAHSLMSHGVHRYPGKKKLDLKDEERRESERRSYESQTYNDLWRTVPHGNGVKASVDATARRRELMGLPEENLLYFLECYAPRLRPWQRELLRIVRNVAQYFYPQRQTQVANEGAATYVHYRILNRLHDKGLISDGDFLEFIHYHSAVIRQLSYSEKHYSGINPYALGFAIMRDVERVVTSPTDEDREWMPDIAGSGDAMGTLRHVWANFRDESLVSQFLSPRLMREMRLFQLHDDPARPELVIGAIHDERGYRRVRRELSRRYDTGTDPNIEVIDVDLSGDRMLHLQHRVFNGTLLASNSADKVLQHLANLWGYPVKMIERAGDEALNVREVSPQPSSNLATAIVEG